MKVLVCMIGTGNVRLSEESKARIRGREQDTNIRVVFADTHEQAMREIADAEIAFGYVSPEMFRNATSLKWAQAPNASLGSSKGEYWVFPELADSAVTVTNASGLFSEVIATHVFAFITSFARDFPRLGRNQARRVWDKKIRAMNLSGKTLGIVGLGGIGRRVALIGAAFGMAVVAVDPKPQNVPSVVTDVWSSADLSNLLRESDFVVLCLPDAPGTVRLIGARQLQEMKNTAYLINIGRGKTVDFDALTQALKNGAIAGAGLDVFAPGYEPLPSDHPLWVMENVIITPHCASAGNPTDRRLADLFLANLDLYLQGKRLFNVIDKKAMILAGPGYVPQELRNLEVNHDDQ